MSNNAQFFIVGVNHHFQESRKLKAAERDAKAIFDTFTKFGLLQSENYHLLIGNNVTYEGVTKKLNRIRQLENQDLLFIYWAGHAEIIDGGVWLLTSQTNSKENPNNEMLLLETLVSCFARSQGFRNYVLILDTCYSGEANAIFNNLKPKHTREGTRYEILTACEQTEAASEDAIRYGWLTGIVLDELNKVWNQSDPSLNLSVIFAQSCKRLEEERQQTARHTTEGTGCGAIVLDISTRPIYREKTKNADFLETAIGYATKAFCSYLNEHIVSNVELIYFLGFDVWDGCLVYDGLIDGSIEQQLLEFIRHKFLGRDRLRSKYEEILATTPEQDINSRLGIAGQCLKEAREAFERNLQRLIDFAQSSNNFNRENRQQLNNDLEIPTLQGLRYIGNLSQCSSEYKTYDLLLGLGSCLYIPVIENFFDFDILKVSDEEIRQKATKAESELSQIRYERKPLGGVLIAANRQPNALTLRINRTTSNSDDNSITQEIKNHFDASLNNNSRAGYNNFQFHLRCLNAVYIKKSEKKIELRQGLHPSLVKRSFKNIKQSIQNSDTRQENIDGFIADISIKIDDSKQRCTSFLNFAQSLSNGITHFIPENLNNLNENQTLDFIRFYLLAILWRDLRIQQNVDSENDLDVETYLNSTIARILQPQELSSISSEITLNNYIINQVARPEVNLFSSSNDDYPKEGEVSRLILTLINDLLDDLREVKKHPSEIVYNYLKRIAPIKKYVDSVSETEGIFNSSISQLIFCDLSHAISIWLVGLWILETVLNSTKVEKVKVKKEIFSVMDRYFNTLSSPYNQTFKINTLQGNEYLKEDFITLFWGIIAAIHDVAIPVQRFKDSCEKFFCQFFGEAVSSQLKRNLQFNIIDVLDHPRFPIYKNAITSLYSISLSSQNTRQRDWLECVFYRAIGRNVGHSTVGSLILVYELEPYSDYCSEPSMWRMVKSYLQDLSDSYPERKEYGLFIPAYLAHAVAFSDLPKLQKLWKEMQDDWRPQNKNESEHSYFERTADQFQISFEQYPLSYLLGLLETILEPSDNYNRLDERIIKLANSKNYEDIFDYHSYFYVENVEIDITHKKPFLYLYLTLWENNMKQEYTKMNKEEFTRLYTNYQEALNNINNKLNNNQQPWELYNQREFDKRYGDRDTQNSSDIYKKEVHEVPNNGKHLSPRAYKVLDMICRLNEFNKNFQSNTWEVKIKFNNVIDPRRPQTNNPPVFIFPDHMPS